MTITSDRHQGSPGLPIHSEGLRAKLASMVGLHGLNFLLPLITLPYLVRTLGLGGFGQMGLALAVNQYLLLLSEYGFTLSSSRDVARQLEDRDAISAVFWNVQLTKLLLVIVAAILLVCGTWLVPSFAAQRRTVVIGFLIVVGNLLTPTWLFLGMDAMRRLTLLTIIPRILAIPATFWLVRDGTDVPYAMAIQSMPMLFTGLLALMYVRSARWVEWSRPQAAVIRDQVRRGWPLFVSSVSTSLYTSSTPLVLGLVAGNSAVGLFSAADKVRVAAQSLIVPIGQVFFPRINVLLHREPARALATIRQVLMLQGSLNFVMSAVLLVCAAPIVHLAYASAASETGAVLRVLSPVVFIVGLSTVLGTHVMLSLSMSSTFSRIILLGGLWHLLALAVLVPRYGAMGAASALLTTEFGILLGMIACLSHAGSAPMLSDQSRSPLSLIVIGSVSSHSSASV